MITLAELLWKKREDFSVFISTQNLIGIHLFLYRNCRVLYFKCLFSPVCVLTIHISSLITLRLKFALTGIEFVMYMRAGQCLAYSQRAGENIISQNSSHSHLQPAINIVAAFTVAFRRLAKIIIPLKSLRLGL